MGVLVDVVHRQRAQVQTRLGLVGLVVPDLLALLEHLGALGVVAHARHVRADEHQVGVVGQVVEVVGERTEHPVHVLEPVPATDLQHEPGVGRDHLPAVHEVVVGPHLAGAALAAPELAGAGLAVVHLDQSRALEHRLDVVVVHVLVLGAERVDRRGDDAHPLLRHPVRHVGLAGEDHRFRVLDVGPQEGPRRVRALAGLVLADVAAPRHARPGLPEGSCHPGRLGVVEDHHVTLAHPLDQGGGLAAQHVLVDLTLVVAERAAVALGAVQQVVDALGEREELLAPVEHHPA